MIKGFFKKIDEKIRINSSNFSNFTNFMTCIGVFVSILFSMYSYHCMKTQSKEYLQKQKPILELEPFQNGVNLYNFGGLYIPIENTTEVELLVKNDGFPVGSLYISGIFKSEINPTGYLVENFIPQNKINFEEIDASMKKINKNFQVSAYFLMDTIGGGYNQKVYPSNLEPEIVNPVEIYSSESQKYGQSLDEAQFYSLDKLSKKYYIRLISDNEDSNTQKIINKLKCNIKNSWHPLGVVSK